MAEEKSGENNKGGEPKKTKAVVFVKSPSRAPFLLGYHEGEEAELPVSQAKSLIEAGIAVAK